MPEGEERKDGRDIQKNDEWQTPAHRSKKGGGGGRQSSDDFSGSGDTVRDTTLRDPCHYTCVQATELQRQECLLR